MTSRESGPAGIDVTVAHPARRYNYWLGGKDNYQADRDSGDAVAAVFPTIRIAAEENRRFLRRAVTYLVRQAGIRQFLDIGTGIPSAHNTHEVAQSIAPQSRVVYVDNDPIVLVHARALLTSSPEGMTSYLEADLRDPGTILGHPGLAQTLDLSRPVGLMLVAILHFLTDDDNPYDAVRKLTGALPAGSHLAISHATGDFIPARLSSGVDEVIRSENARTRMPFHFRDREEFGRFFDGLELVPPGIVPIVEWHNDAAPGQRPSVADTSGYGAVARIR
ncbi:MAG: hypothetical protein JWN00_5124 [Actinomycetia bacterium]|nr:hypothetical protein [Actinomycetes bacterium]